jgi:hypothetical protein
MIWNRTTADRAVIQADGREPLVEYGLDGRERGRHPLMDPLELSLEAGVPRIFLQRR